ncbi:MAG: 2-isopropylmalate synthase [Nitrosarchaeum sp.]|jgi:L-cysteine desulfidase|nr:2-isopropylmalate synthase [Nitrosarchaeum sp.]
MRKYKKYITKGIHEPLSEVQFHKKAPIKRISMLSKKTIPESKIHAAVHFVDAINKKISKYSILHKHDVDEVNILLSQNDKLVYEIQLDDEIYKVSSPVTIFIPKGVNHRADVISGSGFFVCLIMSNKYKTS